MSRVTLVTGFPTSFLATRMVRKILAEERDATVRCVVQEKFLERAQQVIASLPARDRERVANAKRSAGDARLEGLAFDELHDQRADALRFFESVNVRDVRMIERREEACLPLESGQPIGVRAWPW